VARVRQPTHDESLLMPALRVIIPGTPIPAARPRVTRYGTYIPKRQKEYMEIVRSSLAAAMRSEGCEIARRGTRVGLTVFVGIPWPTKARKGDADTAVPLTARPDADNFLKMVMDGGNQICWEDDSQIWSLACEKWRVPRGTERLEVEALWQIEQEDVIDNNVQLA